LEEEYLVHPYEYEEEFLVVVHNLHKEVVDSERSVVDNSAFS
jgi:hypothetical protein